MITDPLGSPSALSLALEVDPLQKTVSTRQDVYKLYRKGLVCL